MMESPAHDLEVADKGYDAMTQRIKEIARESGVLMVENVPLKWYTAVAEVLAVVYKVKKAG